MRNLRCLSQRRPEIAHLIDVVVNVLRAHMDQVPLIQGHRTGRRLNVIPDRPAAEGVERVVAAGIAVNTAHHKADEEFRGVGMLAVVNDIQTVDLGNADGGLQIHRNQAPVVILVFAELCGGREADGRRGLAAGTNAFDNIIGRRGKNRLIVKKYE